jgi:UDP-N-acetylmuramoyl-L-alanyl-D-glutamate--2,6-diaminopimelate ligase
MGSFNASNALLAAAVARLTFELPLSRIATFLEDAAIDGRSEIVPLPSGAVAVIDYAHNGESLSRLLSSLREYADGRLIVLFGSVGERTQMRRAELGAAAAAYADLAILTSDNPGKESPEDIIRDIAMAFEGSGTPYLTIPDRADAIRSAVRQAQKGDVLVLAGKGHETYQLVGSQKIPFSEKHLLVR